jgi:hypothetical protein
MRTLAVVIILTIVATAAFAQSATFEEVNGKVEIRRAGGSWEPAAVGMSIDRDTTISTGFGATAELTLADSTLQVEQLTRMTLVRLVESSDAVDTEVFLNVGRVSANVRTAERRQAFEVRSPVSTAAVRGTRFRFDGQRLQVFEGNVSFGNAMGQSRNVGAGQQSTISGEGEGPSSPQQEILDELSTNINPVGLQSEPGEQAPESFGQGRRRETRGGVTVDLTYN